MNSRNIEKESKNNGWKRDSRQIRFKKDFSGQDFYNQDWKQKKKNDYPSQKTEKTEKFDKSYNISENYHSLIHPDFKWSNYCVSTL